MTHYVPRYRRTERINHWIVAMLFFCAALSGLAFFHPSLYFFTYLFGGGPWTRILHPFLGVFMVFGFLGLFFKFWRENIMTDTDWAWNRSILALLRGDKGNMPPAGRYNAGQKIMFWTFAASLLLLLVTGFMFWQPWFVGYFPVFLVRLAVVVHAASAVLLIVTAIVHVYATMWVHGTLRAMTRGTVSKAWANKNHPLWDQKLTGEP